MKKVKLFNINITEIYEDIKAPVGMSSNNMIHHSYRPHQPTEFEYIGEANLKDSVTTGDKIFYRINDETVELDILENKEVYTSNECVEFMLVLNSDEMLDISSEMEQISKTPKSETNIMYGYNFNPMKFIEDLKRKINNIVENFNWRVKTNNLCDYSVDYKTIERKNKIDSVLKS